MISLDVSVLSPEKVLFRGYARSIIAPGEIGVLEILPFHKRLVCRLLKGVVIVGEKKWTIKRGVIKVNQNKVVAMIEQN